MEQLHVHVRMTRGRHSIRLKNRRHYSAGTECRDVIGSDGQIRNLDAQGQLFLLYMVRWAYLARAMRLGVNILSLDCDVFMFRDPYLYLKAPPLRDINLLVMRDGDGFVNCGIM